MGEVYEARDTRLDRKVAVKVLPSNATDSGLRARFHREGKAISQLSHPNICALYDVGDDYLVMELLEGESLAGRLSRGPLPLADVFRIGMQIASALHTAHRAGIIHRDLKPGNVILTRSGAKLLDFGLAKLVSDPGARRSDPDAVTEQHPLTEAGAIVGTYRYMSPEQLAGGAIDGRSDIFALGAMLYELVTGKRAFDGPNRLSIVAAILNGELTPFDSSSAVPVSLQKIITTCLAKDADDRWQSARDVELQLRASSEVSGPAAVAPARPALARWRTPSVLATFALLIVFAFFMARRDTPPRAPVQLGVVPPPGSVIDDFVLSPQGTMVAMLASRGGQSIATGRESSLWVRDLTTDALHEVPESVHATSVCWSPDGTSIAFIARDALYKSAAAGGPPVLIRDGLGLTYGLSWGAGDTIIFARDVDGSINRISTVAGSAWTPVSTADRRSGYSWHTWPVFLPDGQHFLYLLDRDDRERNAMFVGSLDPKESPRRILSGVASNAIYADGQLLYVRDHALLTAAFDLKRLAVTGPAHVVADQVADTDFLHYSLTAGGGAIGFSTMNPKSRLHLVDRAGRELAAFGEPEDWVSVAWSPDEQRAIVERIDAERFVGTLWMADLRRGIFNEFSSTVRSRTGIWSPDSSHVLYQDESGVFIRNADGSGGRRLPALDKPRYIGTWNGDWVAAEVDAKTNFADIEAIAITSGRRVPVATTPALENTPAFSPDGKWIAYASDGTVVVQPFPPTGAQFNVSPSRGGYPRWRGDGRELYYYGETGQLIAVPVTIDGGRFTPGTPQILFTTTLKTFKNRVPYDVSPDGQRFLTNVQDSYERTAHVVLNWVPPA